MVFDFDPPCSEEAYCERFVKRKNVAVTEPSPCPSHSHRMGEDRGEGSLRDLDSHRAMIRAFHVRTDEGFLQSRSQRGADQEVIDAPADVPLARAGQRTPPRVMAAALLEFAEGVDEARAHERIEARAFL